MNGAPSVTDALLSTIVVGAVTLVVSSGIAWLVLRLRGPAGPPR